MHMDSLRSLPQVIALPPVEDLEVCSTNIATFRYVQQHTALWADLHDGLVTTGRLKQALGMHEEHAAKVLGFSKAMRGSYYLQSAWAHALLKQRRISSSHTDPLAHNEAARRACNGMAAQQDTMTAPTSALLDGARKRNCEAAAMGGNAGTRMAWGTVQEAAAAHCLLHIFPQCSIEEVGLFQVDARTQLPGNWAAAAQQLPGMGASPDALIVHTLQLSAADLEEAAAFLDGSTSSSSESSGGSRSPAVSDSSNVLGSAAAAAAKLLLSRGLSRVATVGISTPSSSTKGGQAGSTAKHTCSAAGSLGAPPVEQMLLEALNQWQQARSTHGHAVSGTVCNNGSVSQQEALQSHTINVGVREVVEVKNHCPFVFRHRRRGAKGRLSVNFGLRDRGPVQALRPEWVPQLQMHMLTTGCMSALLVSRSATKGVRVFRLWRDDAYLDTMLAVLAAAWAHCLTHGGQPPPASALLAHSGHQELLHRTVALAAGAVCVADVAGGALPLPSGTDTFAFWPS